MELLSLAASGSSSVPMPESVPQLPQQIPTYIPELLLSFYGELVYLNRLSSLQNCAVVNQDTIGAFQQLFDHMN